MTPISPSNRRSTLRAALVVPAALVSLLTLTACPQLPAPGANATSTGTGDQGGATSGRKAEDPVDTGATAADTFKQFNDIPIPTKADIDLEQSLVLGTEDGWIGRLTLDVNYVMIDMYAFYTKEMPRFGWEQVTTVRARISTMTYKRGARVATITMQPHSSLGAFGSLGGGTTIDFTVAPANRDYLDGTKAPEKATN